MTWSYIYLYKKQPLGIQGVSESNYNTDEVQLQEEKPWENVVILKYNTLKYSYAYPKLIPNKPIYLQCAALRGEHNELLHIS